MRLSTIDTEREREKTNNYHLAFINTKLTWIYLLGQMARHSLSELLPKVEGSCSWSPSLGSELHSRSSSTLRLAPGNSHQAPPLPPSGGAGGGARRSHFPRGPNPAVRAGVGVNSLGGTSGQDAVSQRSWPFGQRSAPVPSVRHQPGQVFEEISSCRCDK